MVKKINITIEYLLDSNKESDVLDKLLKDEITWALRNKMDQFKDSLIQEGNFNITKDNIYLNII